MKNIVNKTIIINYTLQLIIPLIFTIIFILINNHSLEYNNIFLSYINTSSAWIWLIFWNIERIYFDLFIIFILKYIIVTIYCNLFKNNKKIIIGITLISTVLWAIIVYPIASIFMLKA